MKPIIGVTVFSEEGESSPYQKVSINNIKAIAENGGIPITLPITDDKETIARYLEMVDGILFTGGNDIAPLYYGINPSKQLGAIDTSRDDFEIELYKEAVKLDMPILGICRGSQIINVASGGTLYQDIYAERENTNGHSPKDVKFHEKYHNVNIHKDTKLHDVFNKGKIQANSFHHQAVKNLANGFVVSANADDGIIEAFESIDKTFVMGIQWHPEGMFEVYPEFKVVFEKFIEAAIDYSK